MKLRQFLTALWGSPPPQGVLNIWRKAGKTTSSFALPEELDQAILDVQGTGAPQPDLYHQVGLQANKTGPTSRGSVETCVAVPGFWMDIDILGPGHKAPDLPPNQDAALALLGEFPLPPTLVIHSGGGLQAYWLFNAPWVFASQAERERAQALSRNTQVALMALARSHKWKLDNTCDLARLLRIPGTFNAKDPDDLREVHVLAHSPEHRYEPADFERFTPDTVTGDSKAANDRPAPVTRQAEDHPTADGKLILEHCAWMAHCRDDAASLPEPEWYAMLSVVAACEGGRELAHQLSRPYSKYSPTETDTKFDHAMATAGPRTCENILTQLNGGAYCASCAFAGFVKSPIVLGSNPERTQALLAVADGLKASLDNPARALDEDFVKALAQISRQDHTLFEKVRAVLSQAGVAVRRLDQAIQGLTASASPYLIQDGELHYARGTGFTVKIANFSAEIVEEESHDDGVTVDRYYRINGTAADGSGLGLAPIPCTDFQAMAWVDKFFGSRAIITPNCQAHVAAAIKYLSPKVQVRSVFKHTGWRNLDGDWRFLTTSGALGAQGLDPSVVVNVGQWASAYELPAPPDQQALHDAMAKAEGVLGLLPPPLAFALFSAAFRAPLAHVFPVDFSLYLEGKTGSFKSECAALLLGFYGARFHGKHLPASWAGTENALVQYAFCLKDNILVIDDFNPIGNQHDVNALHKKADHVLRAQGNQAGKARMNSNLSLRPPTPPRGMIVATGEDLPNGHSLQARLVILHLRPGDVNVNILGTLQGHRNNGAFANVMAAFIQYLAGQMHQPGVLAGQLQSAFDKLRKEAAGRINAHTRTPDNITSLALGYLVYLDFAVQVGFIPEQEKQTRWETGWQELLALGAGQGSNLQEEDPLERFGELLASAILGGYGHLQDKQGNTPPSPQPLGWRNVGDGTSPMWRPQGPLVGYLDGGDLYLQADTAYAAVQQLARAQGAGFPLTKGTLIRRLKDGGKILSHDSGTNTIRLSVGQGRVRVLHVSASMISMNPQPKQGEAQAKPFVPPFAAYASAQYGQVVEPGGQDTPPRVAPPLGDGLGVAATHCPNQSDEDHLRAKQEFYEAMGFPLD